MTPTATEPRRHATWLALTALAYATSHHLGSVPDGLGSAGSGTRVADWLDLLVPFLVLAPALLTLVSAGASRTVLGWFAAGSWLYTSGHGIHLAANSVGNAAPGETAHLWDEYVGHYLWYAGVVVVAATLASTMRGRARPGRVPAYALAVAVGATWATNADGGQLWIGGLVVAATAAGVGWRWRRDQLVLLGVAGAAAVAVLAVARVVG